MGLHVLDGDGLQLVGDVVAGVQCFLELVVQRLPAEDVKRGALGREQLGDGRLPELISLVLVPLDLAAMDEPSTASLSRR